MITAILLTPLVMERSTVQSCLAAPSILTSVLSGLLAKRAPPSSVVPPLAGGTAVHEVAKAVHT